MVGRMQYTSLPASARKFLRREKARIRRAYRDTPEAKKQIDDLVADLRRRYTKSA